MARTIPTTEPSILVAGDTWNWTKTLANYPPAEGWTLGYSVRGIDTLLDADVVVTPSGTGYSIVVAKAKTTPLRAGAYRWVSYVDKAGEHYTVEDGVFTVLPNMAAMVGSAGQTHAERTLALIEAKIEGRITADAESYSINGRALSRIPVKELLRLRAVYQAKVNRYRNPGQLGPVVLVQHGNPDGTIGTSSPVILPPWFRALNS